VRADEHVLAATPHYGLDPAVSTSVDATHSTLIGGE
jgi:hypothetical protein